MGVKGLELFIIRVYTDDDFQIRVVVTRATNSPKRIVYIYLFCVDGMADAGIVTKQLLADENSLGAL